MFSIRLVDLPQHPLVGLIQRFGQFVKNTPDTRRKTMSQRLQLAIYPSKPMRQYKNFTKRMRNERLHPVCSFGERLDDKFPVLPAPSPHLHVRRNNRSHVIDNILLLSCLIMEGHPERCQWLESSLNVDFGAAGDTDVQIW